MSLLHKSAAVTGALALAVLPSAAYAHSGTHPFKNCTEAYAAGYANIPKGDIHYGVHLDRDNDGTGCDKPPKDFTPAPTTEPKDDDNLASTGGNGTTKTVAIVGAMVLVAGTGVMVVNRRRRTTSER